MGTRSRWLAMAWLVAAASGRAVAGDAWIRAEAQPGDFPLVHEGRAADIVYSERDDKVVAMAARDLAADIERVTGVMPVVRSDARKGAGPAVFIGTIGKNPLIAQLGKTGKLDAASLSGKWESFLIGATKAAKGSGPALVIAGSDRRGAAYGVYELSQAIGVSPWYWWADVPVRKQKALYVAAAARRFGPPSVQYRGIFINDEDWGLQPWAAKTFEPENGNIGPKTYTKVFELLLRLKANTLWPGMHPTTAPFNAFPQNKQIADDYAIVMGSSHAEPMLRNNVGEWKEDAARYNYVKNRDGVRAYWEQRVRDNGAFENLYTIGMRGIHDSGMQGPQSPAEQVQLLQQVFADQRALLAKHVNPRAETVPQIFVAYKEVLDLYRQGLQVPEDVTIVWPDDNFGYIRNFTSAAERNRKGGFGVYYHLSYLGRPLSYLWLSTTPPALVWEEMHKAYEHGARKFWIANVGDLKPAEIGTEFFLQMAWDVNRWNRTNLQGFLVAWAAREFGQEHAVAIAAVMADYYRLNFTRRPEHLQWWLPKESPRPSTLMQAEIEQRLAAFGDLSARADRIFAALPAAARDAFFELVLYPVRGSALANQRFFAGERATESARSEALAADGELHALTRSFNEAIAGGKWRRFMSLEPADNQWASMRIAPWKLPDYVKTAQQPVDLGSTSITIDAGAFTATHPRSAVTRSTAAQHAAWAIVPGLGRTGRAVSILPSSVPSVDAAAARAQSPRLEYTVDLPSGGTFQVDTQLLPTFPLQPGRGLRLAVGLDDQPPHEIIVNIADGSTEWASGVLQGFVTGSTELEVATAGAHKLNVYMIDAGVALDRIVIRAATR